MKSRKLWHLYRQFEYFADGHRHGTDPEDLLYLHAPAVTKQGRLGDAIAELRQTHITENCVTDIVKHRNIQTAYTHVQ